MKKELREYNSVMSPADKKISNFLAKEIDSGLPQAESKVWHRTAVWFLDGNPIVGYSKLKAGISLMFWSGKDFDEPFLVPSKGRFKDARIIYTGVSEIQKKDLKRWLKKSKTIQWDYKNIVKRKGKLVKLK